ncbi:DNA replication/repair protein RecF [Aestuariimicrobium kwangyangense]|uniref:DNA replication/repair protein RecF n=1 Tax=Aestuariimicrobium kwangyangense TaxID=396389 RepID=UPI0003B75384|nr:DNA replication/repair protein RecF [Aestuariimicrobium kwangyangense]
MYVEHLSLADFRSYTSAEVPLAPGVTVFVGANGQGKTNLVEAVEYLSRLGSHRVSSDAPLVRLDAEQAIVRGRVKAGPADGRSLLLEVEINPGRANRARINKAPLARTRELLGVLRTVVFSPEDLAIVKGDPSDRRAFIDAVVTTRWPRMAGVRADYDRVVKQRNSLLKAMSGRSLHQADAEAVATLEIWDDQVATIGAELLLARLDTLAELMPIATEAYADIAPQNNVVTADYKTALDLSRPEGVDVLTRDNLADRLRQAMAERRRDEIARGVSLVGPHRDDVVFNIGRLPAKGYASHGESWSLALALRLGTFGLLQADGIEPVLVLDDVFAELDATRRERLAESVLRAEQVLVTAAVGADVPEALAGRRFRVRHGLVEPEDES